MSARKGLPAMQVVAGVVWSGGRYLGVRRPEGKRHAGLWEFPGGKVEPGETHLEALVRELREELAIEVREADFWKEKTHTYPDFTVNLSFFHIHVFKGFPRPLEGQGLRWLAPSEGLALPFLAADRDIVEELAALRGV